MALQIIINVATKPDGAPGVPREFPFVDAGLVVTLKLSSVVGITAFAWEILDQDAAASAVLSDPAAAEPTFTMTAGVSGTYLARCTVNGGTDFGDNGIAILTENKGLRKPAASETTLFSVLKGWKTPLSQVIDQVDLADTVPEPLVITPPALTAVPVEDYEPISAVDWKNGEIFRITSSANATIGGFASIPSSPRRTRHVANANSVASGFTLTLKHLGGLGLATSDILIADALDLVLPPNGSATLWEDFTTGKWRVL